MKKIQSLFKKLFNNEFSCSRKIGVVRCGLGCPAHDEAEIYLEVIPVVGQKENIG